MRSAQRAFHPFGQPQFRQAVTGEGLSSNCQWRTFVQCAERRILTAACLSSEEGGGRGGRGRGGGEPPRPSSKWQFSPGKGGWSMGPTIVPCSQHGCLPFSPCLGY